MPCDADCEVGPVHCWNWHRPNHKPDWHDPAACDGCPIQARLVAHGTEHWISCTYLAGHVPWLHSWQTPGNSPFIMAPPATDVRNRNGGPLRYPYDRLPELASFQVGLGIGPPLANEEYASWLALSLSQSSTAVLTTSFTLMP